MELESEVIPQWKNLSTDVPSIVLQKVDENIKADA